MHSWMMQLCIIVALISDFILCRWDSSVIPKCSVGRGWWMLVLGHVGALQNMKLGLLEASFGVRKVVCFIPV